MPARINDSTASGRIGLAIRRLAGKYPFHARILEQFEVTASAQVGTMGVMAFGDTIRLLYAPGFVLEIPLDQLVGVLLHEVHHILFGHILIDPADRPDSWALTVAEEVTANEFIVEPLPGQPIRLELFPDLPPMESTERRYRRLRRIAKKRRLPISFQQEPGAPAQSSGGAGIGPDGGETGCREQERVPGVMDDHSVWQEAHENREQAAAAVRAVIHDAIIEAGLENVPEYLHEALSALGVGQLPGDGESKLGGHGSGQLDWIRVLRRYVGQHVVVQPDFTRPPRRFPELVGIVPGRRRRGARPSIMAAIDTSGSITDELLELINAELARLAGAYQVMVVECDARIQRVYPYRPIRSVHGRGGTDLRPPFEPAFLRKHRPDVLIFFTDGDGPAPAKPPRMPVLWCLTGHGSRPASWGSEVRMAAIDAPKT